MKNLINLFLFAMIILFVKSSYTQDVPYVPTPYEVVEGMLEMAQVTGDDLVYDLGCGDGRIVVTAARKYGARGVGVDSDPQRIRESNANAEQNDVTHLVKFHRQDLFKTEIKDATVVTLFLLSSVNKQLRPKLFDELKPGTRIVSNTFDMDEWKADEHKVIGGRDIYFWRIPENVSGRWTWNDNDEQYVLSLTQDFQKVRGNLHVGEERFEIIDPKLEGNELTFRVQREKDGKPYVVTYETEINDNRMQGKAGSQSWNAEREAATKVHLDPSMREKAEF
jgi:SAM-dependent methyltransferase